MSKGYYNTNSLSGEDLLAADNTAMKQEDRIYEFFRANDDMLMTPSEVGKELFRYTSVPLTSVRRAISNLTKQGVLTKTEVTKDGLYGKPEYCWEFNQSSVIKSK